MTSRTRTKVIVGNSTPWPFGRLRRKIAKLERKGWRVVSMSGPAYLTTVLLERDTDPTP